MFGSKSTFISSGNSLLDKLLGGGFVNGSLNVFERQGHSSKNLDHVWNKSLAASTLATGNNLIFVNFQAQNYTQEQLISSLPTPRKVKPQTLFKDIQTKSPSTRIKIAWRYSDRGVSPSDDLRLDQVDFGLKLSKECDPDILGQCRIVTAKADLAETITDIRNAIQELKPNSKTTNLIINDAFHPFSTLRNDCDTALTFQVFRAVARSLGGGVVLMSYDKDCVPRYNIRKPFIYNAADCVLSFYSYETDQNRILGYKDTDGTIEYVKVPKINSFGQQCQRSLSDYGYRFTRDNRYFVVDELSLPPCEDDTPEILAKKKQQADQVAQVDRGRKLVRQVDPLEEFKDVAQNVIPKKL